jgi:hypothetical protein
MDNPSPPHLRLQHRYSRIGVLHTGTVPEISVRQVYAKAAVFEKIVVKLYDDVLSSVKKT